jgi:16S rRNA (uracil1498-N3)-methyltransferase
VSLPRFFVPEADAPGSVVHLPDDEAAHLTRVLRLKVGDAIRVFDGRGREWSAAVDAIGRQRVTARLDARVMPAPESQLDITLAAAVLKGDKTDDVVRDAVMLGVGRIIPLVTQRTEIALAAIARSNRVSRWGRIAVSSAKQCGRAFVPPVVEAMSLSQALAAAASGLRVLLVEPGRHAPTTLRAIAPARPVAIFVGPEGGWTDGELDEAAAAGALLATLGGQTLRADAVPVVALTAVRVLWKDL